MNWDRIEGNWKQFSGKVKEKWGKLTDDDLATINGKREQLEGKIQERYGYGRDQVKKELDDTRALAGKLGIQGTPHFMVGDRIIPGAPEDLLARMTKLVGEVRQEGCKVC